MVAADFRNHENLRQRASRYVEVSVAHDGARGRDGLARLRLMLEQAGFWGYCQSMLEREFSGATAIVVTAILFALLPHPPMHVVLWPKLILFFFTGLTFGVMAYLTKSILPGLVVHIFGLLAFFTLVFRADVVRQSSRRCVVVDSRKRRSSYLAHCRSRLARLQRLTEPTRAPAEFTRAGRCGRRYDDGLNRRGDHGKYARSSDPAWHRPSRRRRGRCASGSRPLRRSVRRLRPPENENYSDTRPRSPRPPDAPPQ